MITINAFKRKFLGEKNRITKKFSSEKKRLKTFMKHSAK